MSSGLFKPPRVDRKDLTSGNKYLIIVVSLIDTKGSDEMTTAKRDYDSVDFRISELEELTRPVHPVMPKHLWSETLPNLWQGGTLDRWAGDEWGSQGLGIGKKITPSTFDCVYTLYADAEPVSWFVKELRFGFYDGAMDDFAPEGDLLDIVKMAHKDWKSGKKVLIRCQAGLNRSGLVMALVLIRDGYTPADAIRLMREKRSPAVLCNQMFTRWLLNLSDEQLATWRN